MSGSLHNQQFTLAYQSSVGPRVNEAPPQAAASACSVGESTAAFSVWPRLLAAFAGARGATAGIAAGATDAGCNVDPIAGTGAVPGAADEEIVLGTAGGVPADSTAASAPAPELDTLPRLELAAVARAPTDAGADLGAGTGEETTP